MSQSKQTIKTAVAAAILCSFALGAQAERRAPRMAPYLLQEDGATILASADTGEVLRSTPDGVSVLASGFQGPNGLAMDGDAILVKDQRGLWRIVPDVDVNLVSQISAAPSSGKYVSLMFGNEGLRWGVGYSRTLKVNHNLENVHFRYELSRDAGATWETIGETSKTKFTWAAEGPETGRARIRVLALSASDKILASDTTDEDFAIIFLE